MLVNQKIGNINLFPINNRNIEYVSLEWYEANKRILHKKTTSGTSIELKFLKENQQLTQGDVLYADDEKIVVVEIAACDAIIIRPKNTFELASICYEIGNKHLPLFFHDEQLYVAYEAPLFRLFVSAGYEVEQGERKLLHPLKTTVDPHGSSTSESLFSKIMKLK